MVHEQFFTDTTDYADIVLPATTFLEHKDLVASYGHLHLQLSDAAIEPLGESCSNAEVFRRVAARMGLEDECLRASDDELIDDALDVDALKPGHEFLAGINREALEREHSIPLNVPRSDGAYLPFANGFATPSGKAELYSERLAAAGLDPVVAYIAPTESRHGERARRYPLELLARKHDNFLNTTFCNLAGHQKMERRFELQMNAVDAVGARHRRRRFPAGPQRPRRTAFARPSGRQRASRSGLGLSRLGTHRPRTEIISTSLPATA